MQKNKDTWELGAEMRLFNGSLRKLRLEKGLTQAQVAKKIGITTATYCSYETMRSVPLEATATKIAEFYKKKPEDLFPREFLEMMREQKDKRYVIQYAKVEAKQLEAAARWGEEHTYQLEETTDPAKKLNESFKRQRLVEAMSCLSDRERKIISMRYGLFGDAPHTLFDVAHEFSVTAERIRYIEQKALSKLRANLKGERNFLLDIESEPFEKDKKNA